VSYLNQIAAALAPTIGQPPASRLGPVPAATASPAATPTESQPPDIWAQARQQFPILNNPNLHYLYTPRSGPDVPYLETFPPGEGGGPGEPRPSQFPMNQYGIQVYKPDTQPVNILGDAVVHMMRFTDPTIKKYYSDFEQSLTPQQQAILQRQYQHHVQYNGEKRPYQQWYEQSGLTQLFGGYVFGGTKKWPTSYYTPEQLKMFDQMMQYLQTGRTSP
jgi:hypothetical protein